MAFSFRPRPLSAIILAGLLSASLLLEGCAGPRFQPPGVPVPAAYRGESAPEAGGAGATENFSDLPWQDLFCDEELSKLIREAQAQNYDVQIAAARVLEARARFKVSRAGRSPSLGTQGSRLWADENEAALTDLSIVATWELDLWGRIRHANASARAGLLADEQARRGVEQTLIRDVAGAYFLLCDLDLELEITRRALALREESRELVQLRVDNGYSSEIDLREAEALVKSARASITEMELQMEQTENQLSVLLGRNPGPIVRGRSLLEQELAPRLPPGLPSALLERRPDIRQAEQLLIGAHAMVDAARAEFFPRLSLTATSGFESSALLDLFHAPNRIWNFGPAVSLPIFNAGRIQANVRSAEARQLQALLFYKQTVQQAFREVADSLAACRKLAELRTQQDSLVESLRRAAELSDLRYQGGVASYLEYLDSERELLDAQLRSVQIRREELTRIVALYCALGGGWQ